MLSKKNLFSLLGDDTDDSDNEIKNDLIVDNNLNSSMDIESNPCNDQIYDQNCNIHENKKTNQDINIIKINNTIDENDIINQIIDYINRNNNTNNTNNNTNNSVRYPIEIIDGENLIGGPAIHRPSKVKRIFSKCLETRKTIILVVKKSGGVKRFKNYTGIDVPESFIFISLHADNGTCPDDGFILEFAHKYQNVQVVTDDEYMNRFAFNYGDIYKGTRLTTNIGIEGRYFPDINIINRACIRKKNINNKKISN
jgi:hypothetical protein